jgi:hypothetical protein
VYDWLQTHSISDSDNPENTVADVRQVIWECAEQAGCVKKVDTSHTTLSIEKWGSCKYTVCSSRIQ